MDNRSMANVCTVGALVHYPSGSASVDVTAPAWLLDEVVKLDCVRCYLGVNVIRNGTAVKGVMIFLRPSHYLADMVEAVQQIERVLGLVERNEDEFRRLLRWIDEVTDGQPAATG